MTKPIEIAVVGHTNAGKTSLLRTLTRKVDFGEVSEQPGTTRNPQSSDYRIDGVSVVKYWDTPGLEDSASLHHYLQEFQRQNDSVSGWINAFLNGPEAKKSFEQEAKVLRKMLDADAAIYVIDCRADILPKYRCEVQILTACAKPILPVLNFVRSAGSQAEKWRELLKANNLHVLMRFDAVAPFVGSEKQLYEYLGVVLEDHRHQFEIINKDIERQTSERRVASCRLLADLFVNVTAMRREIDKSDLADEAKKETFIQHFKRDVVTSVRTCIIDLLEVNAFRKDDAEIAIPSWQSGRWDSDVLNPDLLLDAGKRLGTGAAVGAAVGLAVDIALVGISLGAASAIGATLGGMASQGWGQVPRKIINLIRGIEELTLEDQAINTLLDNMVRLLIALEIRGHASTSKVELSPSLLPAAQVKINAMLETLDPARSDPVWEHRPGHARPSSKNREKLVRLVEVKLLGILNG